MDPATVYDPTSGFQIKNNPMATVIRTYKDGKSEIYSQMGEKMTRLNKDGSKSELTDEWDTRFFESQKCVIKKDNENYLASKDQYICKAVVNMFMNMCMKFSCKNIMNLKEEITDGKS